MFPTVLSRIAFTLNYSASDREEIYIFIGKSSIERIESYLKRKKDEASDWNPSRLMERLSPRRISQQQKKYKSIDWFRFTEGGRCDAIDGKMIRPHVIGSEKKKKGSPAWMMSRCAHRMEITW